MKTFDEQIKQTLKDNSQWPGSADDLWKSISSQLESEKPSRRPKPIWFGAAAAATIFLAFLLQTTLPTVPPAVPEVFEAPQLRTFTMSMMVEEPLVVRSEEEVELTLNIYPALDSDLEEKLLLATWEETEFGEVLVEERQLSPDDILGHDAILVKAPQAAGSYRLVLDGVFRDQGEFMVVFAEEKVHVEGENLNEEIENH